MGGLVERLHEFYEILPQRHAAARVVLGALILIVLAVAAYLGGQIGAGSTIGILVALHLASALLVFGLTHSSHVQLTRHERTLHELEETAERQCLALDAAQMATFDVDKITRKIRWSKHLELLFGFQNGTFDGTLSALRRRVHPEDVAGTIKILKESVRSGNHYEFETRIVWPNDGSVHWILVRGRNIRKGKRSIRAIGTVIETTERRLMEDSLREASIRADEASRAKSRFLANMSHEMRTPLSAIIGYAEHLAADLSLTPEGIRATARIKSNSEHLLRVIDDILDLSRIEAQKLNIEITDVILHDILNESLNLFLPAARAKGIDMRLVETTCLPDVVRTDAVRLRQVLINLLGNAVKFTAQGGITICAKLHRTPERSLIAIEVEDSGVGVASEAQTRLFKLFAQADDSVSRTFGGTGLGLHLARQLANALGGDLELTRSQQGVGSLFTLYFDPSLATTSTEARRDRLALPTFSITAQRRSQQLTGRRIVLAEDSPDMQFLIKSMLLAAGVAEVVLAPNGQDAVTLGMKDEWDAILMDIQMPHLDGLSATRTLRSKGIRTPIIALSAHAMQSDYERSLAAGCNAHIIKPVEPDVLVETLQSLTGSAATVPRPALES